MSTLTEESDAVFFRELRVNATVGPDRWGKTRPQPVHISVQVHLPLERACRSDDVVDSVHYGDLCKDISALSLAKSFSDLHELAEEAGLHALRDSRVEGVRVVAEALNQFLMADSLGVEVSLTRSVNGHSVKSNAFIKNLGVHVIIGVNLPERISQQRVVIGIKFHEPAWKKPNWHNIHADLVRTIEKTSFLTLEAFTSHVAHAACGIPDVTKVTVHSEKPSALAFAQCSGVKITRTRSFYGLKKVENGT
ncbi:tetrahydrobiopterin biosynthesis enzymes-like protein [Rickenella mellea]|uniref:dihydroneopterin aldolase n=1 Tax=Rickenella mellea TaxID=50990 RepID=A0A4Y7Q2P1_9AGAM|nr:tetrahydrobiopterin biosynthesis enzymes-like protein [Rickenella mellea]